MTEDFWKRKLLAYLHDPPSKVLDLATHGKQSRAAMVRAGFTEEECSQYNREADRTAAAADRFPFPHHRASGMRCHFDGGRAGYHHPLGGGVLHHKVLSDTGGIEGEGTIQPVIARFPESWEADLQWRARFFAHWRLWPQFAAEHDSRFGFLPADTRLPDHTIWNHMQVVSALASCVAGGGNEASLRPAFVKFQIGPVQDFIAQARSTRDLWSGSYLLSWLMAAGLKRLSELAGPDAVIYPSLRGQPLFDLHWKKELWAQVSIGDKPVWDSLHHEQEDLLTPNLPNVFLAVVPSSHAHDIARAVEEAVRSELAQISTVCWEYCDQAGLTGDEGMIRRADRNARFEGQVRHFLSVAWQATPWPQTVGEAQELAAGLPLSGDESGLTARERVARCVDAATKLIPKEHRDGRYYIGGDHGPKDELNNIGIGWALIYALNGWQLDAVRQTRPFQAWATGHWDAGTANNKDSLTGKEEAVAGGKAWLERCDVLAGRKQGTSAHKEYASLGRRFKRDDFVGAITLIKRVWDLAYLKPQWKLEPLPMPNTRGVADHRPLDNSDDEQNLDQVAQEEKGGRYFAVLALDGDQIGQWVAGDKAPPFNDQLATYQDGSGNAEGSLEYFTRDSDPDGRGQSLKDRFAPLLETHRPVSPSYHLQFSEGLTNFALRCARPIVEAFDGRLVYSGGDDVLALLPADTAIACADGLVRAFRGLKDVDNFLKSWAEPLRQRNEAAGRRVPCYQKLAAEGCLLGTEAPGVLHRRDHVDSGDHPIPFVVPGPNASASVGVAIAHFKAPLQDVVRAAQVAEKRAKQQPLDRSAVAVTLMKRSGETIEWGCKWDSGGLELLGGLQAAMAQKQLSAKFPHRVIALLTPYLNQQTGLAKMEQVAEFDSAANEVIRREFGTALERQHGECWPEEAKAARELTEGMRDKLDRYLAAHDDAQQKLKAIIGLCQTVAFAHRTADEESTAERQLAP